MTKKNTPETMDKKTAGIIGSSAKQVLEKSMEAQGVTVTRSGGTYDPEAGTVSIKFTFKLDGADPKEVVDFNRYQYRFPAYSIGDQFKSNGHQYTLSGYRPRATKRPFIATREDGQAFLFTWDALESLLGDKDGAKDFGLNALGNALSIVKD